MKFTQEPTVVPCPHMPLAAAIEFATDGPCGAAVRVDDDRYTQRFAAEPAARHRIPVTGLRFGTSYDIAVVAESPDGAELTARLGFATPPLPADCPPLKLAGCDPERREPGSTMFNVRYSPAAEHRPGFGLVVGVDRFGEIVWYYRLDEAIGDVRRLANGNVLFVTDGRIREVDLLGDTVGDWYATRRWRDREPPPGAVPVDAEIFHHAAVETPAGTFLACSIEIREIEGFPASDEDPGAGAGTARVVGDVIVEFMRDGTVIHSYPLLDILDPLRIGYGSRSAYWQRRGYPDTCDWSHVNAIALDFDDDSIIVSVRHQDCLIKIDRLDGALKWILGTPENWRAPWSRRLLKPAGDVEWPYHQHDCSLIRAGAVLCFDNGNHRAVPWEARMPAAESYSRAVEFHLDEYGRRVRQAWEWGRDGDRVFSSFQSGALRLPATGNTFVTYGGICSVDGAPAENPFEGHCRARWIEVTPDRPGEIVFDLGLDDDSAEDPVAWSSFRAERFPELGATTERAGT